MLRSDSSSNLVSALHTASIKTSFPQSRDPQIRRMPGYAGFQLSVELTRFLPLERLVNTGVTRLVNFARELRQSGEDIVVEEELAAIFGRGRISAALEKDFKRQVNIQKYTPLSHGSDLDLAEGMGPTVLRAFQEQRYFATVLTLSMLSYLQAPTSLARMISKSISLRLVANVPDSPMDPGFEGIMKTLMTCSSQTAAFQWSTYMENVEHRIKETIPGYCFQQTYTVLPHTLMTGAMDFLYLAQSLPEDRIITVSNQAGCITLIIWAHYILGLSVVIDTPDRLHVVVFGTQEAAQVHITWSPPDEGDIRADSWDNSSATRGTEICLYDKDRSVILTCTPEEEDSLLNRGEPSISEQSFLIITSYTETQSTAAQQPSINQPEAIVIEAWRVINSARLLFHGMDIDPAVITSYAEYFGHTMLDDVSLPTTVTALYKSTEQEGNPISAFLSRVKILAKIVLLFAHVVEVSECGELPLILEDAGHRWQNPAMHQALEAPTSRGLVNPGHTFDAVAKLISDPSAMPDDKLESRFFLSSGVGWSIFYDTIGSPDPSQCRPELVHVRRGTPMNRKTREIKFWIRDGNAHFATSGHPGVDTLETGAQYVPRSVARITQRTEYWSSQPREFELTHFLNVEPNADWQQFEAFREYAQYRIMIQALWQAHTTPECSHYTTPSASPSAHQEPAKLGPDAAVFHGWDRVSFDEGSYDGIPNRVLIFLTFAQPSIRWLALTNAVGMRDEWGRQVMLRRETCCVECALEYTVLKQGRWVLIL
ncbi:hypothetical protein BDW59DRAFT_164760 [Aspergillus cavernicola]|uniref:Uncharacterized protein n=1 Tax=Aspergillus cavernicola TaxID=176166 RepID=A0ABR4HXB7_9EURO